MKIVTFGKMENRSGRLSLCVFKINFRIGLEYSCEGKVKDEPSVSARELQGHEAVNALHGQCLN
jgi:hypothetical protein